MKALLASFTISCYTKLPREPFSKSNPAVKNDRSDKVESGYNKVAY